MEYFVYCIISIIVSLLGFVVYLFLSKVTDKNGKTMIMLEIAFIKVFRIKFKSEHESIHH